MRKYPLDPVSLQRYIEKLKGICLEIGGPTKDGFELLAKHNITLPSPLVVTNITLDVISDELGEIPTHHQVDKIADVKKLPFVSGEIAVILVSNLPLSSDDTLPSRTEYATPLRPDNNLHLHLYRESTRVLVEGGVIIQVNAKDEDIAAAQAYGFTHIFASVNSHRTDVFMAPIY